uniref:TATA-binding protein-associated factor 172 n=1 Tax=Cacopsylla melanoneura TaxID=428564 RepID=A0A8D8QXG5_9HEMI
MTSRLDRLFVLLESGSTPYTRQAAATQLGELQRLHPHELHTLLRRTYNLLRSSLWDTRVAASQAVGAVVKYTPPWNPPEGNEGDGDGGGGPHLTLDMLDIACILDSSQELTASQGNEFDMEEDTTSATSGVINTKDSLQRARQQLNAKLGFPLVDPSVTDSLVTKEDLLTNRMTKDNEDVKPNVGDILSSGSFTCSTPGSASSIGMSSREANRARRKARLAFAKSKSNSVSSEPGGGGDNGPPDGKRVKLEDGGGGEESGDGGGGMGINEAVPDMDGTWGDATEWPLEGLCDRLCADLFSPVWEVRHGVATALREILKVHGHGAGKTAGQTKQQMTHSHLAWLEDVTVRLLCVLALDRFGDFVSDQVVAPVRETCAQALGVVMSHMSEEDRVIRVVDVLLTLTQQKNWETRHGGLLGLKYILAVKQDLVNSLLPRSLPLILSSLSDPVDDVANIAAATLIPVAPHLVTSPSLSHRVPALLDQLWTLLAEQDQLTSACNNFMSLLAAILCHPDSRASTVLSEPVMEVLPRLWPYLSHSTSSVRLATLQTMATLTRSHRTLDCSVPSLLATLRHVYQRSLVEHVREIQDMIEEVWESILTRIELNSLLMAVCPHIAQWLCLAMQPANVPFDNSQLISVEPKSSGDTQETLAGLKFYLGGVETVPLVTREANSHRARVLASRLLGLVSTYVIQPMTGLNPGPGEDQQIPCPVQCYVNLLLVYVNSKSALQRMVAGLVISDWNRRRLLRPPHEPLNTALVHCLEENIYYDEVGAVYTKLLHDTTDLLSFMKHYELVFDYEAFNRVLTLDEIEHLVETSLVQVMEEQRRSKTAKCLERVDERRKTILSNTQTTRKDQFMWQIMVQAVLAGALVQLQCLPAKLNPVIKPLMEALKFELNPLLQELAASHVGLLLGLCSERNPCPNNKIVSNLCTFLCCNPEFTPVIESSNPRSLAPLIRSNSEASTSSGSTSEPTTPSTPGSNPGFWSNNNPSVEHAYPRPLSVATPQATNDGAASPNNPTRAGRSSAPSSGDNYTGILTLVKQQQTESNKPAARGGTKASGVGGRGPGRPSLSGGPPPACDVPTLSEAEYESHKQAKNQCRGASLALTAIVTHFGESLPDKLGKLWEMVTSQLINAVNKECFDGKLVVGDIEAARNLVVCLQVFEVIAPSVHPNLLTTLVSLQPRLCLLLSHPYRAVRHMSSRCLAVLATLRPNTVMTSVLLEVVPLLAPSNGDTVRQGAVEALMNILDKMGLRAVPFLVLLVVPLLGRISDQDEWVRLGATSCFATCINLLPLDSSLGTTATSSTTQSAITSSTQNSNHVDSSTTLVNNSIGGGAPTQPSSTTPNKEGVPTNSDNLPAELVSRKATESRFLEQLFDPVRIPDFQLPTELGFSVQLRSYQQAGVNWLWFLNRYGLHGILCDDMGLGKTLQSLCVLAGDHYVNQAKGTASAPLRSLVVCPPTLTGHWMYEVVKFLPNKFLNPLQYAGPPHERDKLKARMMKHNLIIASYDIIRKDIHVFSEVQWNYCILDEGHVIKNDKAKSTRAIKQLRANHRLILSGTPIQNNVLELWSLFDFLMPGFLGTEKQFSSRYARPILASRDPKCSSREQEAGVLAMEALHRQVLPLVLRRVKQDVLKDLPPKITQDYYCELSPLQEKLYEDFARMKNVDLSDGQQSHVFQSLRYLQSVCNHPKLVLSSSHAQYESLVTRPGLNLADIKHAAKLPALKQLLVDCGIGTGTPPAAPGAPFDTVGAPPSILTQHRALIFCQLKAMLDIVENDLFKTDMPSVTYLRLDGSVPTMSRHSIVTKFNSDPTIDVLLLTTQVGGLGLNLTGADTVIFVEHDWSPMKDLQAMDRAHRIGQKKVVNVYRLITKNTLEEKIMNLQKFKLLTANTVINSENRNLETMATGKLLDLFSLDGQDKNSTPGAGVGGSNEETSGGPGGLKNLLDTLPELWDEREYQEEYDLSNFVQSLNPPPSTTDMI